MKCQDLFSLKNKKKMYKRMSPIAVGIGALRVKREIEQSFIFVKEKDQNQSVYLHIMSSMFTLFTYSVFVEFSETRVCWCTC